MLFINTTAKLMSVICLKFHFMEFGLLDFLIAYAIREMYHYTVDTSDTQM